MLALRSRRLAPCVVVVLSLAIATQRAAHADPFDAGFETGMLNDFIRRFETDLVDPAAQRHAQAARARARAPRAISTQVRARTPRVPAELAASAPPAERAARLRLFTALLTGYAQVEDKLKIPRGDVAGALATALAGAYTAYRGGDLPDECLPALVGQLREVLAHAPAFTRASESARQDLYERLAIVGLMLASAGTQTPLGDPRELRGAARAFLERLTGMDPDRLELDAHGLRVTPAG